MARFDPRVPLKDIEDLLPELLVAHDLYSRTLMLRRFHSACFEAGQKGM
jgi:hypothetical protein